MERAGGGLGEDGKGGALRKVLWGGGWSGSMASPEGWAPRAQWVGATEVPRVGLGEEARTKDEPVTE